ncbi:MAG: helix-turn-helix domain-containing protein [Phycisphaera sp.]|nr:helix-turn-helix domain-containing protein [Phycisphaera sp.]
MPRMPRRPRKRKYRVSMLRSLQRDHILDTVTGILDYGRHTPAWQFVGRGGSPFYEPDQVIESDLDGLIGDELEDLKALASRCPDLPIVSLTALPENSTMAEVSHDNRAIGRMGAEYLLGLGFARFAFFTSQQELGGQGRLEGFRQTVEAAGRPCLTRFVPEVIEEGSPSDRVLIRQWIEELPKPIAIMTFLDYMARLSVNAAVDLGLRVPDEVAVLGVNNNAWTSVMAVLPVSSVKLNLRQLGYAAAEALDVMMQQGTRPPPRTLPPIGVVTRQSTDITLVDDPLIRRATSYIRDHVAEGLRVENVLDELGVSRSTLVNRMKAATGQTTQQAIRRAQIEKAKQMLVATEMTMERIAHACGFECQPRLNEAFKRLVGMTPGQFRLLRTRDGTN